MLAQVNLISVPALYHVVIIAFMNGRMPEKPIHAGGHVEDYEGGPSMYMPILLGGKCIGSRNGSDDIKESEVFASEGPITPTRLIGRVDALCYVKFASLRSDSPRFHPAGPLKGYTEALDTFKQRPPLEVTRNRFVSPLTKFGMISAHACLQGIAGHMLGTEKCLDLALYRMAPWEENSPVMLWLHGKWAVFSDAWGTLG